MDGCQVNSRVSYTDAAFPGTLPVLNQRCVDQAVKTGLALGGTVNRYSHFDRKHYFYQDLPQGYQITQYREPIVKGGGMVLNLADGRQHTVRVSHIQLEQDSGKSVHDIHPRFSLVDLNRAGIGLMEIVSEADFRSSEQVGAYIKQLQHLLKHIGSSDANMQFGEMRCDVNISVHRPGTDFGVRVELKNMISIKSIVSAIDAEASRQVQLLSEGHKIQRETRGFNQETGETFHLRTKEDEVDYRFFPEPDLPPLILHEHWIQQMKQSLGELPDDMLKRLINTYDLTPYEGQLLVEDQSVAHFFEQSLIIDDEETNDKSSKRRNHKKVLPWIFKQIFAWINDNNSNFSQVQLDLPRFKQFLDLIDSGYISSRTGNHIISEMLKGDKRSPREIIDSKGMSQLSDDSLLEELCKKVIDSNPKEVNEYKQGRTRVFSFFVGEIMKQTKGRSNPQKVDQLLKHFINQQQQQK
eukprot:gene5333-6653_t